MSESPADDLLSAVLSNLNLSAKIFGLPSICGAWQINTTGAAPAQFHLISRGSCYLHMRHIDKPLPLRAGDLVVVMHGDWHVLSASPVLDGDATLVPEAKGPFTNVICGQFEFPERTRKRLIELLPALILVRSQDAGEKFGSIMRLMADEGFRQDQGSAVVLDKLADALFVMVLRHYIANSETPRGVMAALADPKLRVLIAAIHRQPGEDWTIDRMLKLAPLSRSALIERFSVVLSVTPVNYVVSCRMLEAERLLLESKKNVATISAEMGYSTEAAFRRAFKRVTGRNASDVRRSLRAPI
jgi:AraC family transcriptional regulator, activator of mtrCDE